MTATATTPVQIFRLTLPIPPSANHSFDSVVTEAGTPIRVKSQAYKDWIREAGYGARWERLTEDKANGIRWRWHLVAYGLSDAADVDNLIKPTQDLICAMTGLRDNWPMVKVTAERSEQEIAEGERPWIAVTIEVLGEAAGWRERREARRKQRRRGRR